MLAVGIVSKLKADRTFIAIRGVDDANNIRADFDPVAARVDLVRRWLGSYGPGTAADLQWWTGWGVRQTRETLEAVGAVDVALDGDVGYVLPNDLEPVGGIEPWVALLPALDSTVMGWQERDWYLGGHRRLLFDRNGNAGPTVWVDGRVVGGWGQRPTGEVAVRLLEDVGSEPSTAIATEAARVEAWLGDVKVTPRFRTPVEKELG